LLNSTTNKFLIGYYSYLEKYQHNQGTPPHHSPFIPWYFANKNINDKIITITRITRGVSHYGLAICIIKVSLKAKEELWKLKILVHHAKI
jgi:hypothetical protein